MQQFIYPELEPESRVKTLAKLCLRTELSDYSRTLKDDELIAEKDAYSRDAISFASIEAEEKEVKADFASKKKALKSIMEQRLKVVKSGKREVNGNLFLFADQIGGKMNYYDKFGEQIISRPLRPDEKQTKLFIGEKGDQPAQGTGNDHGTTDVEFEEVKAQPGEDEQAPAEETAGKKKGGKKTKKTPQQKGEDLTEKVKGMTARHKATREKIEAQEGEVNQPFDKLPDADESAADPFFKPGDDLPE